MTNAIHSAGQQCKYALQVAHSGIDDAVLLNAREMYGAVRYSYTQDRILVSKWNMMKLIDQFANQRLKPLDPHPERILTWMIQTGEYMPDPKYHVVSNSGFDVEQTRALFYLIRHPQRVTLEIVYEVFFKVHNKPFDKVRIENDPYDMTLEEAEDHARREREAGTDVDFVGKQNDLVNPLVPMQPPSPAHTEFPQPSNNIAHSPEPSPSYSPTPSPNAAVAARFLQHPVRTVQHVPPPSWLLHHTDPDHPRSEPLDVSDPTLPTELPTAFDAADEDRYVASGNDKQELYLIWEERISLVLLLEGDEVKKDEPLALKTEHLRWPIHDDMMPEYVTWMKYAVRNDTTATTAALLVASEMPLSGGAISKPTELLEFLCHHRAFHRYYVLKDRAADRSPSLN